MSTVDSKKKVQVEHDDEALVGGKSKLTEDVFITFDEEMQSLGLEAFGEYTWAKVAEAAGTGEGNVVADRDGTRRVQADESSEASTVVEDVSAHPGAHPPGPPAVSVESHIAGSTNTIQVVATSPEERATDNHQDIAYSFVGDAAHSTTEIYWDPEAGIGYGEAPVSASWTLKSYGLATTLLGALLCLAL